MSSAAVQNKKIQIVYDNYRDSLYAKNAQQEVEAMRTKATKLGAGITTAGFVANEIARVSLRSRKYSIKVLFRLIAHLMAIALFKIKAQNVVALLLLPTFFARQAYESDIEKRIEDVWRVHKNRVDRGLGPTWSKTGHHASLKQDHNLPIPNVTISSSMLWEGAMPEFSIDNAFMRHHQSIADYPSHLSDIDDYHLTYTDEFERFKKFKPAKKNVVGNTPIIPMQDNDEAFNYYDIQGESLYTNPPDHTYPLVDHGTDEDHIWAFHRTLFNQQRVKNSYATDQFSRQLMLSHAPFWGQKMSQPHFFKPEKVAKFNRHWNHKIGLENLKMKHAILYGANPTPQQREVISAEINKYVADCYQYEKDVQLRDVHVTDHIAEDTKGIT